MTNSCFLFVTLFFSSIFINAQKTTESEPINLDDKHNIYNIHHISEHTYVEIKNSKNNDISIQRYDLDLKKTGELDITFGKSDHKKKFERVIFFNNKAYIFYTQRIKSENKQHLFYKSINMSSFTLNDDEIKLHTLSYHNTFDHSNFNLSFTNDNESLIISILHREKNSTEEAKHHYFGDYHFYDSNMTKIKSKSIERGLGEMVWNIGKYEQGLSNIFGNSNYIDSDGISYNLVVDRAKNVNAHDYNFKDVSSYNISVTNFDTINNSFKINTKQKVIDELRLHVTSTAIICYGFYSENNEKDKFNGIYRVTLNKKTGDIINESYDPFSKDFLSYSISKGTRKKNTKKALSGKRTQLSHLYSESLIRKPDEGFFFIGEGLKIITTTSEGMTTTSYSSQLIYIWEYSKNGQLVNELIIPKKQFESSNNSISESVVFRNGKLGFLLNDHAENIDKNSIEDEIKAVKGMHDKDSEIMFINIENGHITSRKPLIEHGYVMNKRLTNTYMTGNTIYFVASPIEHHYKDEKIYKLFSIKLDD